MKIYLVGVFDYSNDNFSCPNADNFPKVVYTSFKEAKIKYDNLAKYDYKSNDGCRTAYLAEMKIGKENSTKIIFGSNYI